MLLEHTGAPTSTLREADGPGPGRRGGVCSGEGKSLLSQGLACAGPRAGLRGVCGLCHNLGVTLRAEAEDFQIDRIFTMP